MALVKPGACCVAFQNDVGDVNRYWYYYAEATDGAAWAGDFPTNVTNERFDHCDTPPNSTIIQLGFRSRRR